MLVYLFCLLILGTPVLLMEFAAGRAAQVSPLNMFRKLQKPGGKWGALGWLSVIGNFALMAFYCVVTGWMIYYFVQFALGRTASLGFVPMITNPVVNVAYLFVTVVAASASSASTCRAAWSA